MFQRYLSVFMKSFVVHGRASRTDYWTFGLTNWVILMCFAYLGSYFNYLYVLALLFALFTLPANITLTIRRCHDFDKSGWFALLCFLPYVNFLAYIIIGLIPGTKGPNRYGYPEF